MATQTAQTPAVTKQPAAPVTPGARIKQITFRALLYPKLGDDGRKELIEALDSAKAIAVAYK